MISVAIIAKNEEHYIARCLESVKVFADDIVVVDTGSTDATKEIARHYTQHVFDSEFFDQDTHFSDFEFGKAKNEAIKRCVGDWVIWVDCDDVFDAESAGKIVEIGATSPLDRIYSFQCVSQGVAWEHVRMFPNHCGIVFDETHACHEYLLTQGYSRVYRQDIKVYHKPGKKTIGSVQRNLAILEKDYYERGRQDPRTCFYLGNAYREGDQPEKAAEMYRQYVSRSDWPEERLFALLYLGRCQLTLRQYEKAIRAFHRAMAEDHRFAEPYCGLGDVYSAMGKTQDAMSWYRLASLREPPADARLFVEVALYNDYPLAKLSDLESKLNGIDRLSRINLVHEDRSAGTSELVQSLDVTRGDDAWVVRLPRDRAKALLATAPLSVVPSVGRLCLVSGDDLIRSLLSDFIKGVEFVDSSCAGMIDLPDVYDGSLFEAYGRLLGIEAGVTVPCRPVLKPPMDSLDIPSEFFSRDVAVLPGWLSGLPQWWSDWVAPRLVGWLLSNGWLVFSFGHGVSGASGYLEQRIVREAVAFSRLYIGPSTWLACIAAAYGRPSVILWDGCPGVDALSCQTNIGSEACGCSSFEDVSLDVVIAAVKPLLSGLSVGQVT